MEYRILNNFLPDLESESYDSSNESESFDENVHTNPTSLNFWWKYN